MGPSIATEIILQSELKNKFNLIHLDTSDRRDLNYLGSIDFRNIFLALKQYSMLLGKIVRYWPDIVYIPLSQTTIGYLRDAGFILIAKIFRRKVICHLRGGNFRNWYHATASPLRWFVRIVHSFVDGQVVLGECLKPLFKNIVPSHKIYVIPNAANYNLPAAESKDKFGILFLANFIRSKGILDVLYAVPMVLSKHPEVEFVFAGNWRDAEVQKQFEQFAIQNPDMPVSVAGPQNKEQKLTLLKSAKLFVFPTYYPAEGHPWVLVEALAAGLPIISTDHAAIKETVLNNRNGYLVEPRNSTQIANKINYLIEHPKIREEMASVSRKHYEKNFTEEHLVKNFTYCFNSVLGRNKDETTPAKQQIR